MARWSAGKIGRLLDYAPELGRLDIPDPFHSDEPAFLRALELIESGTRGLWDHLRKSIDLS